MHKYSYTPKWKQSDDSIQDSLRKDKAEWNSEVSDFLFNFINFKMFLNGKKNDFYSDKISLSRPFPDKIIEIINQLKEQFSKIDRKSIEIIDFQQKYSINRKKKIVSAFYRDDLYSYAEDSHEDMKKDLIKDKKAWNNESKKFINDLINFLWLINGKSNKFHNEKSVIKDPIPSDPKTIIGTLESDFNSLIKKAESIVDRQKSIYELRENKRTKESKMSYGLIKQSSSPISRFFTKLFNPGFGSSEEARKRRFRVAALNKLPGLSDDLTKFQANIVGGSPQSVIESVVVFNKIENDWLFFLSSLELLKNSFEVDPSDQEDEDEGDEDEEWEDDDEEEEEDDEEEGQIAGQSGQTQNAGKGKKKDTTPTPAPTKPQTIINMIPDQLELDISQAPDVVVKATLIADFIEKNKTTIINTTNSGPLIQASVIFNVIKRHPNNPNLIQAAQNLFDAWELFKKHVVVASNYETVQQIEKVAQYFLHKMIGKTKHSLPFISDETSASRIDIYNKAKDCISILDKLMNSLQAGFDFVDILNSSRNFSENLEYIKKILVALSNITIRDVDSKELKDFILKSKYSGSLTESQQKKLEQSLDSSLVRSLTQSTRLSDKKLRKSLLKMLQEEEKKENKKKKKG